MYIIFYFNVTSLLCRYKSFANKYIILYLELDINFIKLVLLQCHCINFFIVLPVILSFIYILDWNS